MSAEARVTVLVPAFNEEAHLAATLASVRAQTRPPFEIVVVDDGSTDRTAEIAEGFGARVVRQANRGISAARNRGLAEARGDYVALLDGDDLWEPERLAWFERARVARPDGAFFFADHTIDEDGVPNAPSHLRATPRYLALARGALAPGIVEIARGDLARALAYGNFLATSTIVVRRELVRAHDLRFDEALPLRTAAHQVSEDVEWYLRVLRHADAVAIERVVSHYVRSPNRQADARAVVRLGDVILGERVAEAPDRYAPGAAEAFREVRRAQQREAANLHARLANYAAARTILASAQRERFSVRDAATIGAFACADCRAGRAATRLARATWRTVLRPAVRGLAARGSR